MRAFREYQTDNGDSPFEKWFLGLNSQAAIKVRAVLARMEAGNLGDVKPVGQGVSSRRINYGPGYRLYFGNDGDDLVVLLVGGTKSGQSRDIQAAKKYWADYKRRRKQPKG